MGGSTARSVLSRADYRPDIDGIRGFAAILVMGFHAKVPGFEGGYIGLDLFFVVSGFVIAGLLLTEHERTGTIRWGAFYARRARRLIPAKATMILGVLLASAFVLTPTGAQQDTARSAAAAAGFVSNVFFWQASDRGEVDYFAHQPGTGVLLHTWSLSVEEQFYLALPVALLLAWLLARLLRVPPLRVLLPATLALGAASVWLAVAWSDTHPDAAYYLPMTRAFEFLVGVALALVCRRVRLAQDTREVLGLAGAALAAFVLWKPMPVDGYPGYWALVPCLAAVLLVWAGVGGPTAITRFLSLPLLVGLGLLSYGWYLWHWPFLVLGESLNLAPPPLWARVLLILLALGVAWLSYRYVEGLFYRRTGTVRTSRGWGSPRILVAGVTAMASVAALSGAALAVADDRAGSPHWQEVVAQLTDRPSMPEECLEPDEIIPGRAGRCDLVPFERGRPTVVLWGDSHAWMFIPALETVVEGRDVNLVAFVMGGCPAFLPPASMRGPCGQSNRAALAFVRDHAGGGPPLKVLVGFSYETYRGTPTVGLQQERAPQTANASYYERLESLVATGTPALFDQLGEAGADVDVLGPTPIVPRNVPLCEAISRPYSCDAPRTEAIKDELDNRLWLEDLIGRVRGGAEPDARRSRLIDVADGLCNAETCFARADGVTFYFDDNHLSARMSRSLRRFFLPVVDQIAPPT